MPVQTSGDFFFFFFEKNENNLNLFVFLSWALRSETQLLFVTCLHFVFPGSDTQVITADS